MRILVIGRDLNLFNPESESYKRVKEYADLFTEYHVLNMVGGGHMAVEDGKLRIWPTNSFLTPLAWLDAVWLGRKLVKKYSLEIVDAQDAAEAGLAAFFVSKFCKIPLRLQIHTDILSPHFRRASWKEGVRYWLARLLIPRADCVRVVSERIKRSLISNIKYQMSDIFVLPIFTDISKFVNASSDPAVDARFKDHSFKIISVGRFVDKEKNFSMLLDATADLLEKIPELLLVLVGDGRDRARYEAKIRNNGLGNNVVLERRPADLASFYKSFDLFVLPSNYEGWGRVVVEAMASGLPVLMTDVGLAGEVLRNGVNGVVVPVGDKKTFLRECLDLAGNLKRRKFLGIAGQNTVKNLIPQTREEYLKFYKNGLEHCKL